MAAQQHKKGKQTKCIAPQQTVFLYHEYEGREERCLHWFEIPAGVFTGWTWKGLITKENLTCALKGRP